VNAATSHWATAAGAHELETPDVSEQLFLGEHADWLRRKRAEKRELLRRELYPRSVERNLSRHRIDAKLTNLEDALITPAAGAPQDGADARNELRIVKRLAHSIFVSPDSMRNRDLSPELSASSGLPPG
jgi:Zn-finger domain-containing protein